jgi:hypothetical protein
MGKFSIYNYTKILNMRAIKNKKATTFQKPDLLVVNFSSQLVVAKYHLKEAISANKIETSV